MYKEPCLFWDDATSGPWRPEFELRHLMDRFLGIVVKMWEHFNEKFFLKREPALERGYNRFHCRQNRQLYQGKFFYEYQVSKKTVESNH